MQYSSTEKGRMGERDACSYLIQKDYSILELNFKSSAGEVDIVAIKDVTISFFEIKTWESYRYEDLEYAINTTKKRRIILTSLAWLRSTQVDYQHISYDVLYWSRRRHIIRHIVGAFEIENGQNSTTY